MNPGAGSRVLVQWCPGRSTGVSATCTCCAETAGIVTEMVAVPALSRLSVSGGT